MHQLNTKWGRFVAYFEAWIVDHEILRIFYRNFHTVGKDAYRSNHPSPSFVKKLAQEHQIKTILNIRGNNRSSFNGDDFSGQYKLELEACEKYGIQLLTTRFSSRDAPRVDEVLSLKKLLTEITYPVLFHCKSGADRAGLVSTLYLYFHENVPIESAVNELSIWKGHVKWAETGILDFFFETYIDFHKNHPDIDFETWLTEFYDYEQLTKSFRANKFGKFIVNKILRRE
ncbi:tyrosine-protein phosphatase [Hydrogenovibrio kuenenii]|uniref:tyrosine-protein phosphatase n=1 Tax=Hydrogenovibrio kuenenii TaxID=63658 RepID=UPI000463C616|nr:tyrosine-protein phosphatase [Hydrogenovibrio kuenenii]